MTWMKGIIGFGVLAILGAVFFVGMYFGASQKKPAPTPAPASAPAVTPASPTVPVEKPKEPSLQDRLTLATVGKGEGIEHPFIQQLMADPTLITDPQEQYSGDRADKKALKRWAGRQAYLIATKFGYISWKFGAEIRIRRPGEAAFLLSKDTDGRLHVAEFMTATPGKGFGASPSPARDRLLASSISESQFLGDPDNQKNIPVYAYLYAGQG